jgi:OmpA-OmpF porin, OOP family
MGDLSAHTDAKGSNEYNDRLSKNRAEAAKSALVAMGIDASRLSTSASSEGTPIATNTDDDTGRRFNRRVELRVKDKSGKEICKSIPPDVPSSLKQ